MASDAIKVFCRKCHAKLDLSDFEPFTMVACPECGTNLRVPLRFDRYLLEKVCGIGGMSIVYRAIEPELSRRVAVKILKEEFIETDPGGKRFLDEARLVARINHPGVIPIYNCGVCDAQPFLAMRYMEKGNLEELVRAQSVPDIITVCRWLTGIAEGLEFALRERIVHHDLKPGNIMLTSDGEAKLGDFDLADLRDDGDSLTLCDGWGSPGYVSPERLLYGGEDFRGDVFSLGVTLYELLTYRTPFGLVGEPEELLERRRDMAYDRLIELNSAVRPELSALVDRMLRYAPEERPAYPEIIEELRRSAQPEPESDNGHGLLGGFFKRNTGR